MHQTHDLEIGLSVTMQLKKINFVVSYVSPKTKNCIPSDGWARTKVGL